MPGQTVDTREPHFWNAPPPVPEPKGHYSHAVGQGGLVWVSGLVGNERSGLDVGQQARAALSRLRAILAEDGLGLDRVLTTTVYTTSPDSWGAVDAAYRGVFGSHRPARAIIPGAVFAGDCLVEIQAVAWS